MPADTSKICNPCCHANQKMFGAEVAIHFPGLDGLSKPIVWVFPECSVCLTCGFAEFFVPQRELRVLVDGKPVDGALVVYTKPAANAAEAA